MNLDACIGGRRLVVTVGPGGVGKTSLSAALAARAAKTGQRALVITVDPAKRLASVLGLSSDVTGPTQIALEGSGSLYAMMLDTEHSFDALLERVAPRDLRESIFDNRMYRAFSRTLARSHAYIAGEVVLHALESADYDLVVLDCPPSTSAIDILDASTNLARLLDSRSVRVLSNASSRWPFSLLSDVTGEGLLKDMAVFFGLFSKLSDGFRERAERMRDSLCAADTAFVLVTIPEPAQVREAERLFSALSERNFDLQAIVYNRAYVSEVGQATVPVEENPNSAGPLSRVRNRWAKWNAARAAVTGGLSEFPVPSYGLAEGTLPVDSASELGALPDNMIPWPVARLAHTPEGR